MKFRQKLDFWHKIQILGYFHNFGTKDDISQKDENLFLYPKTLLTYKKFH